jgi:hypothetical protein
MGWTVGEQILVGATFSAHIQTSPRAHPASYRMGTRWFQGVKQLVHGINHPPTSSAKVKEIVELYLYSPSVSSWQVIRWTLLFTSVHQFQPPTKNIPLSTVTELKQWWSAYAFTALFPTYIHTQHITLIQNSVKITLNPLYASDNKTEPFLGMFTQLQSAY